MSLLFSRLLVGIEDSEPSRAAVALAIRLASEHGGRLVFCHAVNWRPLITEVAASGAVIDPDPIIADLRRDGAVILASVQARAREAGVDAVTCALEGEPAEQLLARARDEQCTLIVMGTHGREGLEHVLIGSTTEAVLRGSAIPVLTVRASTKIATGEHRCFARIVAGIDDSEPSDAAIAAVAAMPVEDRREVVFCSVADGEDLPGGRGYYWADVQEAVRDHARVVVDRAVALSRARGIAAEGAVLDGQTCKALIEAAAVRDADLIVVGSHGRRGLRRFFLGSVAECVVRRSTVPVLVARSAAAYAAAPNPALAAAVTAG
jgi:nucleotide-binding universal stress UspA family protein